MKDEVDHLLNEIKAIEGVSAVDGGLFDGFTKIKLAVCRSDGERTAIVGPFSEDAASASTRRAAIVAAVTDWAAQAGVPEG